MLEYIAYSKDKKYRLEIERDLPEVGFYLNVYLISTGEGVADYLQDTLEIIIEEAEELYQVKSNEWTKI